MALPKQFRLRRSVDVRRVLSEGKTRAGSLTVFYWLCRNNDATEPASCRIALITSRRLGKATARNRVRRRIAAILAGELHKIRCPVDIVVVVRRRGVEADFEQLQEEIRSLLQRIGLYRDEL